MVETHQQAAQRVLRDTLGLEKNSELELALTQSGFMYVGDWPGFNDFDLDCLQYVESDGDPAIDILPVHKRLMRMFRFFIKYKIFKGEPQDYLGLEATNTEFEAFCISPECHRMFAGHSSVAPTPTSGKTILTSTQSEFEMFRKGIKRDPSLFPILKEDSQWDSWNRSVHAIARAPSVEQVLDGSYTPINHDEVLLFGEKQKYMYSVFERCLQSDKGKALVRLHEATFGAQEVYKQLLAF